MPSCLLVQHYSLHRCYWLWVQLFSNARSIQFLSLDTGLARLLRLPLSEPRHVKVQGNCEEQPSSSTSSKDPVGIRIPARVGKLRNGSGETKGYNVLASDDRD